MIDNDTIVAISTPAGTGAIAVIRLSGEKAIEICDKLFHSPVKNKKLIEQKANTVHFGRIQKKGKLFDEVVATIFKQPHSYTGEDTVEISCHGSVYIQQQLLQLFIENGARMAQPGEFTLRAFRNGKIDLSQAEAVADLIVSKSEAARRVAMQQMRGGFSDEIKNLRKQLLDFASLIELELDFSEEDVEFADRQELQNVVEKILYLLRKLSNSFDLGNVIKNGIPVVIVGEPNVGKSTLLNAILNEEKAIVSEIAGTTRDAIEDIITINGITFRFIDTAGLRQTTDKIEQIGIERAHQKIEKASVVLLMVDGQNSFDQIQTKIDDVMQVAKNQTVILVVNKIDKIRNFDRQEYNKLNFRGERIILSAKTKAGISTLIEKLTETINLAQLDNEDIIVTNARHYSALIKATDALERVINGLAGGISSDFVAQDIRETLHYLGEITGEITTNEILENIFEKFCIGK